MTPEQVEKHIQTIKASAEALMSAFYASGEGRHPLDPEFRPIAVKMSMCSEILQSVGTLTRYIEATK